MDNLVRMTVNKAGDQSSKSDKLKKRRRPEVIKETVILKLFVTIDREVQHPRVFAWPSPQNRKENALRDDFDVLERAPHVEAHPDVWSRIKKSREKLFHSRWQFLPRRESRASPRRRA
jgi:hypothetical protein